MRDNFLFEEIDVPLCLSYNLEDNKKSLIVFYICSFGLFFWKFYLFAHWGALYVFILFDNIYFLKLQSLFLL